MIRNEPDIRHKREREVTQPLDPTASRPAPEVSGAGAPQTDADKLIKSMSDVSEKAKRLFQAAAESSALQTIPVSEETPETRAAVNRIDPNSNGSFITFELYMEAKERANKRLDEEGLLRFAGKMTGMRCVDSKAIRDAATGSESGKDSPKLGWVAHFALLIAAQQLLSGPLSFETRKQTSTKPEIGSEAPGALSSWIVTLGLMMALHVGEGGAPKELLDTFKDDLVKAVDAEGLTPEKILADVNKEATSVRSTAQMSNDLMKDADWHVTENYADDFLAATQQPGYEDWLIADAAREVDRDMVASVNEAAKYGRSLKTVGVTLPNEVYKLFACRRDGENVRLDMAAAVLQSKYGADLACCLVMFFGKMDLRSLKYVRTLLGFLIKGVGLDLGNVMNRMGKSMRDRMKKQLMEPLFHAMRKFFDKIGKEVKNWLNSDEEKWKMLFACTPIDEMVEYLLKALMGLKKMLMRFLIGMWDDLQLGHVNLELKIGYLGDKTKLTQMLKLLNAVINAIEKGNLCAKDGAKSVPIDAEVKKLVEDNLIRLPNLKFTASKNPYLDFSPVSFTTPNDVRIASAAELTAGHRPTTRDLPAQDCLQQLVSENIVPLVSSSPLEGHKDVERIRQLFEDNGILP